MPFLRVNRIDFPIADATADEARREIGKTSAAFDGTLRRTRQAVKRDLAGDSVPVIKTEGHAWDSLIRGLWDHVSFDSSLYSDKGLGPSVFASCVQEAGGLFSGRVRIPDTFTLTYPAGLGSNWTVAHLRNATQVAGAANWESYVVTSGGSKWVAGASNDGAATGWLTVAGGNVSLAGDGASRWYDELVILPFVIPAAWGPSFHNMWKTDSLAYPQAPRVRLTGDALEEATSRLVMGDVPNVRRVQGYVSGAFHNNLAVLSVAFPEG